MTARLLQPDEFLDLVDRVLESVGRAPITRKGRERQIVRVDPEDRVLQILAGPGSGKTEMLVWRVLYELLVLGKESRRVIVTTFTRKAATELSVRMVERSDALLEEARARGLDPPDPRVHDLRIGTIHSLCDALLAEFDADYMAAGTQVVEEIETRARLTRVHRYKLGYSGRSDRPRTIDRLIATDELVALFRPPWDGGRWPTTTFDRVTLLMQLLNRQTETWLPRCGSDGTLNGVESGNGLMGLTDDLITLQERWEEYLDEQQILDFATIQRRFHDRQTGVLPHVDHVFVDEFQDTNPIQLAIHLGWLDVPETRLTVVGDDDQALYRFRGSDIECFLGLEAACQERGVAFRLERLEENWRSTRRIVAFAEAFREQTVLSDVSMPKTVTPGRGATPGRSPRLVQGPWSELCEQVAREIGTLGAGRIPGDGQDTPPSVAVLMFSTSEKQTRRGGMPAYDMRAALEAHGLRVYNPRNKAAAEAGSPVQDLTALVSYLIDPVVFAPAGANGRDVMVWASHSDRHKASFAPTAPPPFPIAAGHSKIQKRFRGSTQGIRSPQPRTQELTDYLDRIRDDLIAAEEASSQGHGRPARLTLAGMVARLLAFPHFRDVGFTPDLFREALFTRLLEANIAPTRRSQLSLDDPLRPTRDEHGKVVWPREMWSFLNVFGTIVEESDLDDDEVDAFAEHAVALLTFHQAKGLEFDHVYLALTGRDPNPHSVLQTQLFSGEPVAYQLDGDAQPHTDDPTVAQLALADREREVYVALTRPKTTLTILHDPNDSRPLTGLNPGIEALFADATPRAIRGSAGVTERKWRQ